MGRILASLFEFVLVIVVGRLLGRVVEALWGRKQAPANARSANPSAASDRKTVGGRMARDPICGTFVSTELSHRLELPAGTLHFCSPGCRNRYEKATVA
jgi:YHS domain-containing protein